MGAKPKPVPQPPVVGKSKVTIVTASASDAHAGVQFSADLKAVAAKYSSR